MGKSDRRRKVAEVEGGGWWVVDGGWWVVDGKREGVEEEDVDWKR